MQTLQRQLADLLTGVPHRLMAGNLECPVWSLTADSRQVTPGALFMAVRGLQTDGHRFLDAALDQGASALVVEELTPQLLKRVQEHGQTVVQVQQSRQVLAAMALLSETPKPNDDDIDAAMSGNLCRCATYQRIRAGIHEAARRLEA